MHAAFRQIELKPGEGEIYVAVRCSGREAASNQCPESRIRDILATRRMIANPLKQQIPSLRCAPVGMTELCQ